MTGIDQGRTGESSASGLSPDRIRTCTEQSVLVRAHYVTTHSEEIVHLTMHSEKPLCLSR